MSNSCRSHPLKLTPYFWKNLTNIIMTIRVIIIEGVPTVCQALGWTQGTTGNQNQSQPLPS